MTEEQRIRYEDYYRELFLKQILIDRKFNPMAAAPKTIVSRTPEKLKLPAQAAVINNLMNKSMLLREIAAVLGITQQAVSDTKKRYGLPRPAEEPTSTKGENHGN